MAFGIADRFGDENQQEEAYGDPSYGELKAYSKTRGGNNEEENPRKEVWQELYSGECTEE